MKYNVAIVGATGMVGQRFIQLLQWHPWFNISMLAASRHSEGKQYSEAVEGKWYMDTNIPESIKSMTICDAKDIDKIAKSADIVFCAVDMPKNETIALEEAYAARGLAVISNNSANRLVSDIPMLIPELNYTHAAIINEQRKRLKTDKGLIAVKPNCSIQSYVPAIYPLLQYEPKYISVCTYQAISGAGKTFDTWPEMVDNVIPFIAGEDEKSEIEPLKIFGHIEQNAIVLNNTIKVSAQCIRVSASNGHMAAVSVKFAKKPSKRDIIDAWNDYNLKANRFNLPSAPKLFLSYFEEENRPQTRLDRNIANGMGISIGRLREDSIFDWKFVSLSHNTVRGAAGGAILMAELLVREGYINGQTII